MADTVPEYDWCGGMMDRPMELVEGEMTGLPFPARADIVLEGWIHPTESTREGPFGEWHGYYAGEAKDEPLITIDRAYYRNDPILTCAASQKPPHSHLFERCFLRSAALLDSLEGAGIPDVRGAWLHQAGAGRTFAVVSIKQRYFGHSTQVGLVASQVESGRLHRALDRGGRRRHRSDRHPRRDLGDGHALRSEDADDAARPLLVVAARHDGDRLLAALQLAHGDRRVPALRALDTFPRSRRARPNSRRRSAPNGRSSTNEQYRIRTSPSGRGGLAAFECRKHPRL